MQQCHVYKDDELLSNRVSPKNGWKWPEGYRYLIRISYVRYAIWLPRAARKLAPKPNRQGATRFSESRWQGSHEHPTDLCFATRMRLAILQTQFHDLRWKLCGNGTNDSATHPCVTARWFNSILTTTKFVRYLHRDAQFAPCYYASENKWPLPPPLVILSTCIYLLNGVVYMVDGKFFVPSMQNGLRLHFT